jgi:hypothetical protein
MPKRPEITRREVILRRKKVEWANIMKECYEHRQMLLQLLHVKRDNDEKSSLEVFHDRRKESLVKKEDHSGGVVVEVVSEGVQPSPPAHHPSPSAAEDEILETGEVAASAILCSLSPRHSPPPPPSCPSTLLIFPS